MKGRRNKVKIYYKNGLFRLENLLNKNNMRPSFRICDPPNSQKDSPSMARQNMYKLNY